MCRAPFSSSFEPHFLASSDLSRQLGIILMRFLSYVSEMRFPEKYRQRREETEAEIERRAQLVRRTLMIGNEHRLVREPSGWQRENVHEWTAFLRSEDGSPLDEIIDHVIFEVRQVWTNHLLVCLTFCCPISQLHPTFTPSRVRISRPPFSIRRLGWGTFEVTLHVYYKPPYAAVQVRSLFWLSATSVLGFLFILSLCRSAPVLLCESDVRSTAQICAPTLSELRASAHLLDSSPRVRPGRAWTCAAAQVCV